jgi:peptide-methionine (S)-S-oxide reductase
MSGEIMLLRTRLSTLFLGLVSGASLAAPLPSPALDATAASTAGAQTAVLAGGCFWGVEAVFRHTRGVTRAVSGYAGGAAKNPTYEMVSSGTTGHAEAVEVTFDPAQISYGQLLRIFMSVAHDPTELNRQGPDVGTQYRSAIFYTSPEQQKVARAYIAQLDGAKAFPRPIVTQVAALSTFYPAEAYHQNYLATHMNQPYIVYNDLPKLEALKTQFPTVYAAR